MSAVHGMKKLEILEVDNGFYVIVLNSGKKDLSYPPCEHGHRVFLTLDNLKIWLNDFFDSKEEE